jgi:hypothetical protein
MSIRRYNADADTTITNAYKANLSTRATGSNMGESDILEVFNIYAQASSSSSEMARVLIKFPTDSISTDRTSGIIPASGTVSFFLKLYNAEHPYTTPTNFTIDVSSVTREWDEGHGLDMEDYSDMGATGQGVNTFGGTGASWNVASAGVDWSTEGGDFGGTTITTPFTDGDEDLEIDVTSMVESWITTPADNYGFMVKLNSTFESGSTSFYTKKFFGRGTEFFYKQPTVEARWNNSEADDRANFYSKSNLRTNNNNVISIKNYVDGVLTNIPSLSGDMTIKFYETSAKAVEVSSESVSIVESSGVYKATVVVETLLSQLYASWQDAGETEYHTESITVKQRKASSSAAPTYVTAIKNLKKSYSDDEIARFRLFIRLKDWSPTIYNVATKELQTEVVESAYYKIVRVTDELTVIDYGKDTIEYTKLSYDSGGCYFDLDMSLLETGWAYRIEFMYKVNGETRQQPETFKFRVE